MRNHIFILIFCHCLLLVNACTALVAVKPVQKSQQERLNEFPTENLPLQQPATVYWNQHLVPFVHAQTDADCAFLLGTIHAHLRLGQISLSRRIVQGRLAESSGPVPFSSIDPVSIDEALRIADLDKAASEIEKKLPPHIRQWLEDFVRGLNHYQGQVEELPVEMEFLAIEPEPWSVKDVISISHLPAVDVNWFSWVRWLEYRDKPYWDELWARYRKLGVDSTPSLDGQNLRMSDLFYNARTGSNAFVAAPDRTDNGAAMLVSDPHLGISVPNVWLIAGYQCPSYHVAGLMFPGIPAVLAGRNQHIAWSATNMRNISSDLYEIPKAQLDSLTTREETIKSRWWFDKTITIRESKFGPLLSDAEIFNDPLKRDLAFRWLGHQPSDEFSAFLGVNRATNWHEFRQSFKTYGISGQNFLYADQQGHIGLLVGLSLPVRNPDLEKDFVLDATNPAHDWERVMYSLDFPYALDPPEGVIASANNMPFRFDPPIGVLFTANDRINRLHQLLNNQPVVDFEFARQTHLDVYVESAVKVRDRMLELLQQHSLVDSELKQSELYQLISQWDGHYRVESRGALALQLYLYHFIPHFYERLFDENVAKAAMGSEIGNEFFLHDLNKQDIPHMKESLRHALQHAPTDLERYQTWGDLHRYELKHQLGNVPVVGSRFKFKNLPAPGSSSSLNKTAHRISNEPTSTSYGAQSRFIARMHDPDENYFVLLGGQDGWLQSENFLDQVPLWQQGEYLKIPLRLKTVQRDFTIKMPLKPTDSVGPLQ